MDFMDGIETVHVYHRSLTGTTIWESLTAIALKRASWISPVTVGQGAQLHATRARWHFKANSLDRPIKKGDRFDSDVYGTWEVAEASLQTLGTRYACECWLVTPPTVPILDEAGAEILDEAGLAITEG